MTTVHNEVTPLLSAHNKMQPMDTSDGFVNSGAAPRTTAMSTPNTNRDFTGATSTNAQNTPTASPQNDYRLPGVSSASTA